MKERWRLKVVWQWSCILMFFFCFVIDTNAQTSQRDSLVQLLQQSHPDSEKVVLLRNLGYAVEQTDTTFARANYTEGLQLSRRIHNSFLEAGCFIDLGDLAQLNGKYDSAEMYFRQALSIGLRIHSPVRIGSAYLNIGNSFLYRNQQQKAIDYYILAANYLLLINDNARLSALYSNIAAVFNDMQNYPKSLEYGEKAIDYALKAGDAGNIASAYVNTSNTLDKLGQRKKSVDYLLQSLHYAKASGEPTHLQDAYQNLAERYLEVAQYLQAKTYADSSLYYARNINSSEALSNALNTSGVIELNLNHFDIARSYLLASNTYSRENGGWKMLRENFQSLAELEEKEGHYKQALEYEQQFAALKDSTLQESINKEVAETEAKFQSERKQLQINDLLKTKQLQALSLQQKNTLNIGLLAGIMALLIIAGLYYLNVKRRQQLAVQKEVLQTQRIRELEQEKQLVAMDAILKGQEDERSRMAKDLHDGLGGLLSGVKLSLSGMQNNDAIHATKNGGIARSIGLLDTSISELRRIARNLMPEALVRFGLKDALYDFIHPINELSSGFHIYLQVFGWEERINPGTEIVIFRILQELINNILKHAGATEAHIQLVKDEQRLSITVEDNGKGFDVEQANKGSGMTSIRSRVEYLNGKMDIQSATGAGTFINIEIENLVS